MTNTTRKELSWKPISLSIVALVSAALLVITGSYVGSVAANTNQTFSTAQTVVAGVNTTAVLSDAGEVWVRGQNNAGQLGVGDLRNRADWTRINLPETITEVSSQYSHTLALGESGAVYTWGDNSTGTAGNDTAGVNLNPTPVSASYRFTTVSAGENFSVGLNEAGNLYFWGTDDGLLGTGEAGVYDAPQLIETAMHFQQIKAGADYVVALDVDGNLWTWGHNDAGQLGNGSVQDVPTPTMVATGMLFNSVNTNVNSQTPVAINTDGRLMIWGSNEFGQGGIGTDWRLLQQQENERVEAEKARILAEDEVRRDALITQCVAERVAVWEAEQDAIIAEAVIARDAALVELERWRAENIPVEPEPEPTPTPEPTDEPTDGATTPTPSPTPTPTPTPTTPPVPTEPEPVVPDVPERQPAPNYTAECTAIVDETFTYTDVSGLIPAVIPEPDLLPDLLSPVMLLGDQQFAYASTGDQNGNAVDVEGNLYGWGSDKNGQSGIGVDEDTHTQVPVNITPEGQKITQVENGSQFAAALNQDGNVLTWGLNTNKSLGSEDVNRLTPTPTGFEGRFTNLMIGKHTSYIMTEDGRTYSWGSTAENALGVPDTADTSTLVDLGSYFTNVSSSGTTHLASDVNGFLFYWGDGSAGTFGNNSTETGLVKPTKHEVTKFTSVAAGNGTSLVSDVNGDVWAWGSNATGIVNLRAPGENILHPIMVPTAHNITRVALTSELGAAFSDTQDMMTWGVSMLDGTVQTELPGKFVSVGTNLNSFSILTEGGQMSISDASTAGQPVLADSDVVFTGTVTTGNNSTFAAVSEGKLFAWGTVEGNIFNVTPDNTVQEVAVEGNLFSAVAASASHIVSVDNNGIVYGWGNEPYGTFGSTAGLVGSPTPVLLNATRSN